MKRITKSQKSIVEKHLEAAKSGKWDYPANSSERIGGALGQILSEGKTIEAVHQHIVAKCVSMTSTMIAGVLGETTGAYKRDYTKGMKQLLNNLNVQ